MLQPKRTKFRKVHKGRNTGLAPWQHGVVRHDRSEVG